MPCEGTIVNWRYKPGKTSNMVSLIPEARKYNIHKNSRRELLYNDMPIRPELRRLLIRHYKAEGMTISRGPAIAMTIPVRVVVFVFLIICLMCSFAVCSEMHMA